MEEERVALLSRGEIPPLTELAAAVVGPARGNGVDRLKRTGGEPLLTGGVPAFVAKVAAIPGVREVRTTANGTRLAPAAAAFASGWTIGRLKPAFVSVAGTGVLLAGLPFDAENRGVRSRRRGYETGFGRPKRKPCR